MLTEKLWNLLKSYINDAIDKALDERGYTKKENYENSRQQENFQQKKSEANNTHKKTAYEEFEEKYKRYQYYSQKNHQGYQSSQSSQQKTKNSTTSSTQEEKYYKYFELSPGASFEEIKQAYKREMKKYHPDKFADNEKKKETAEQICRKLNEAYDYFDKKNKASKF